MLILDIILGFLPSIAILLIGYGFVSFFKLQLTFRKQMIMSYIFGIFFVVLSQFITFILTGHIITIISYLPILLTVFSSDWKVSEKIRRYKNTYSKNFFLEKLQDNKINIFFLIPFFYLAFRILFYPPYASDTINYWVFMGKMFYTTDQIIYPTLATTATVDRFGVDLLIRIDPSRAYPINIPLVISFYHAVTMQFNPIIAKNYLFLVSLILVISFYDLLHDLGYSHNDIFIILGLLLSVPELFLLLSVGYADGILGAHFMIIVWALYNIRNEKIPGYILFLAGSFTILIKLEGLFILGLIGLAILFFRQASYVKTLLFSTLGLVGTYILWVSFVYSRVGQFFKFATEGGENSLFSSNLFDIDRIIFFFQTGFNLFNFGGLLFLFLGAIIAKKHYFSDADGKYMNFIRFSILLYMIPWYIIFDPGSGPRPLAHIVPLIGVISAISVNVFGKWLEVRKFKNLSINKNYVFSILVLLNLMFIAGAPLLVNTQFPNLIVHDDLGTVTNLVDPNSNMYSDILHGTMEAQYLISRWMDCNLPVGQNILISRIGGGALYFIENHSVYVNSLGNVERRGFFYYYDFLIENKIDYILFDSIYLYPNNFWFGVGASNFTLMKSFKYNATLGKYLDKPVFSSLFRVDHNSINSTDIIVSGSNAPVPSTSLPNNLLEIDYTIKITGEKRIWITDANTANQPISSNRIDLSLANYTYEDISFPFVIPDEVLNSYLFETVEMKVSFFQMSYLYTFPRIHYADI